MSANARILTSLVGSYAQPSWLIDRDKLRTRCASLSSCSIVRAFLFITRVMRDFTHTSIVFGTERVSRPCVSVQ